MKPGKPVSFGTVSGTTVLGLPGNPFAAMVGLIVVGWPIPAALDGRSARPRELVSLAGFELEWTAGRAEFFPARRIDRDADPLTIDRLGKGGSARLRPLTHADGLGFIESQPPSIRQGDLVAYHPMDALF